MTIEEMIDQIQQVQGALWMEPYSESTLKQLSARYDSIIAALKAGQEMRDTIVLSHLDTTGYGIYKPHGSADGYHVGNACVAWDKATKENK